jgi:hypothetical protein
MQVSILAISHFDQDKCHCEEPFDRPVLSVVEGLRTNHALSAANVSATKQSQASQVEIASLPSVARNDRM